MKNLFLASLILVSTNVFASKIVNIKTLTNTTLDAATKDLFKLGMATRYGTKKVLELKGSGTTPQELRENAVAQALHTVCGFFDDGVKLGLNSKDAKGSLSAVVDLADASSTDQGDVEFKAAVKAVTTMNNQVGVEVYSGSASGNNTVGSVLGIYDVKNNEIAVFANTNCGSDE